MTLLLLLLVAMPECDAQDPTRCAAPINKGDVAPFDGQILTPALAIVLSQKAERCEATHKLEVDYAKRLSDNDLELERMRGAVDVETHRLEADACKRHLEAALPPWYAHPIFVATVASVLTSGAFTLAIIGAGKLRGTP